MNPAIVLIILLFLFPATTSAQNTQQPTTTSTPTAPARPRLADSATGYIDNAIIGSQIRFRFDSGFGVNAPDRAEFFYGKCGCFRSLPPSNPAFDPNAPGPGNDGQIETDLYFQELRLDGEYAVKDRLSVFAEIPARAIEPKVVSRAAGLSDIRAGFKGGIIATDDTALTAQLRAYVPTGDARQGLGTNHWSLEPELLYHQKIGDGAFSIAGQTGIWIPTGGSAGVPTASSDKFSGSVFNYGFGGSYYLVDTPRIRIAPVIELVGWRVLGGFETLPLPTGPIKADGTNIVNVKIGTRIDSGGPGSFYIGFGRAVTDAVWYQDIVRAEYRFAF
jgi:hypothetical protein